MIGIIAVFIVLLVVLIFIIVVEIYLVYTGIKRISNKVVETEGFISNSIVVKANL